MITPEIIRGNSPLVLAQPHCGTYVPPDIWGRLNPTGQALADTDWHIDRLYAGLVDDITIIRTPVHRYVIDVNRDPMGTSLYPGQNTTTLCPTTDFNGAPIYRDGQGVDAAEMAARRADYFLPYHQAIEAELDRVRAHHGYAILYDCHSIRNDIPFLFDGILPDFNIGSNMTTSCHISLERSLRDHCQAAAGYTSVCNGRFKGGWTTRHYGQPKQGIHAIQMELSQSTYMTQSPPWTYDTVGADRLRPVLKQILTTLQRWSPKA